MKKKKNIIKKIKSINTFKFFYKKSNKHFVREFKFKFKKFDKILNNFKSIIKINKFYKKIRLHGYFIKNKFLYNKSVYFNYISNGMDLKYDLNLNQNFYNVAYINNFKNIKIFYSKIDNLDIIKLQKYIKFIDQKYIYCENYKFNLDDYFILANMLYYSLIINIYNLNSMLFIQKLINKYF